MKTCQRCNKQYKSDGLTWSHITNSGESRVNLCGNCCSNLIVICLSTKRLNTENLLDYAEKHSEKLF